MIARIRHLRRRLRYGPLELWALLRNPVGRLQLRQAGSWLVWPLLGPAAGLWRRTVLRRTPVVAVIGSYGKTTTVRAIAAALGLGEPRQRGNSWSFLALAVLAQRPGRPLVLEVGISRPGQMAAYARMLRPQIVVVTAIGSEHRISLGSLETIQAEKGRMVARLAPQGVAT